jgi:hypothetical protein
MSYVKFCLFWATKETKTGNSISSPIGLVLSYVESFWAFSGPMVRQVGL